MEIKLAEQQGSDLQCAFCHGHLPPLCTLCDDCGTRMHFACQATLGRCPTLGCASSDDELSLPAPPPDPQERSRRKALALLWQILRPAAFWAAIGFTVVYAFISHNAGELTNIARVHSDFTVLESGIDLYQRTMGATPKKLEQLWKRPADSRWQGPYLLEENPTDPWGNRYVYRRYGGRIYLLVSYGADGVPGGDEDGTDIIRRVERYTVR